jgi:hypothetical protein
MPRFVSWSDESSSHIVSRHRDESLYTPRGVGIPLWRDNCGCFLGNLHEENYRPGKQLKAESDASAGPASACFPSIDKPHHHPIPHMGGSINTQWKTINKNEETLFKDMAKPPGWKTIRNIFTEPLSAGRRPITSLHPDHVDLAAPLSRKTAGIYDSHTAPSSGLPLARRRFWKYRRTVRAHPVQHSSIQSSNDDNNTSATAYFFFGNPTILVVWSPGWGIYTPVPRLVFESGKRTEIVHTILLLLAQETDIQHQQQPRSDDQYHQQHCYGMSSRGSHSWRFLGLLYRYVVARSFFLSIITTKKCCLSFQGLPKQAERLRAPNQEGWARCIIMIVVLMARALCLTVDIAVSFSQAYRKITKRTKKYRIIVDKNDARNPWKASNRLFVSVRVELFFGSRERSLVSPWIEMTPITLKQPSVS